jgi:molybdate transport system ATP-binding protein
MTSVAGRDPALSAQLRIERGAFSLDAELTVAHGSVLALLGPNGAGKSTALRALAGLVPLDDGFITLDGGAWTPPPTGCWYRSPSGRSAWSSRTTCCSRT